MINNCIICNSNVHSIYESSNVSLARYGFLKNKDEAMPPTNLKLDILYCEECSFAWNNCFDYKKIEYHSDKIIEAGNFSKAYIDYQKDTAKLINKLLNKELNTVVEIGAGKGIFLNYIEANRKIAIEPSAEAISINKEIEVFNCYFEREKFQIPADLVIMRQVLEHIPNPVKFIQDLICSFESKNNLYLYIEVPSSTFTFKKGRFYDYYYEHCNYFTHQSLIVLCKKLNLNIDFISSGMNGEISSILLSTNNIKNLFIKENNLNQINSLKNKINQLIFEGKRFLFWGASGNGSQIINELNLTNDIMPYVIDSDINKQGMYIPYTLQQIISPESAVNFSPKCIIITSQFHQVEIMESCSKFFGDIECIHIDL